MLLRFANLFTGSAGNGSLSRSRLCRIHLFLTLKRDSLIYAKCRNGLQGGSWGMNAMRLHIPPILADRRDVSAYLRVVCMSVCDVSHIELLLL